MVEIKNIAEKSPADGTGIRRGDFLISINGNEINDVLDYMYYSAEDFLKIKFMRGEEFFETDITKNEYDDLGLEFETFLMDEKKSCRNRCIFCFIDQMPPDMRETLYFKDDDARLSFLQGNYVTLTNLDDSDIDRIVKMKFNINVSVHTTNPDLRVKMMRNKFAGEKLKYIYRLAENKIDMNCQIVCCPDVNDGEELVRTLSDLEKIAESITSIAVVPVGVTKYRENLYPIKIFTKQSAGETIDIIESFQEKFLEKTGSRTVFPSDEFFLISGREIPGADYYEDYPQYENGVGMLRSLTDEFEDALDLAEWNGKSRQVSIATGCGVYPIIEELAKRACGKFSGLECKVYSIVNDFFGHTITVTGLITGRDLVAQLKGKELGEELLISEAMLKRDEKIFLDDVSLDDAERELGVKIRVVRNDGYELLDGILGSE